MGGRENTVGGKSDDLTEFRPREQTVEGYQREAPFFFKRVMLAANAGRASLVGGTHDPLLCRV